MQLGRPGWPRPALRGPAHFKHSSWGCVDFPLGRTGCSYLVSRSGPRRPGFPPGCTHGGLGSAPACLLFSFCCVPLCRIRRHLFPAHSTPEQSSPPHRTSLPPKTRLPQQREREPRAASVRAGGLPRWAGAFQEHAHSARRLLSKTAAARGLRVRLSKPRSQRCLPRNVPCSTRGERGGVCLQNRSWRCACRCDQGRTRET